MAEDVAAGPSARPVTEAPAPSRAERAHASAYYSRFTVAYTLVAMVAAAAIAALVIVLLQPDAARGPRWSTFVPTGSSLAMERQIATQVSAEYKSSTASRLVTVFPVPLEATRLLQTDSNPVSVELPIKSVAVQPDVSTGKHEESDFTFFSPDSMVAYTMCGVGGSEQNCAVPAITGADPARLLRREALELSLYTLKYVPDTNAVVTYLPPPANPQAAETAVLIARKDFKRSLSRPLTQTLKPQQAFLGAGTSDAGRVEELTRSHVYSPEFQTLPGNGTAILVLTPAITGQ